MSACTKDTIIEAMLAFYDTHNRAPISNKDEIPFSKRMVQTRFGNWNDALIVAGIPVHNHKAQSVNCTTCKTNFVKAVSQLKRSLFYDLVLRLIKKSILEALVALICY